LRELVEADNDATLVQLAERLGERTEVYVSGSTISRTLSKLGITRKKKVSRPVKSTATPNNNSATTTGKTFEA
jgi:transposase